MSLSKYDQMSIVSALTLPVGFESYSQKRDMIRRISVASLRKLHPTIDPGIGLYTVNSIRRETLKFASVNAFMSWLRSIISYSQNLRSINRSFIPHPKCILRTIEGVPTLEFTYFSSTDDIRCLHYMMPRFCQYMFPVWVVTRNTYQENVMNLEKVNEDMSKMLTEFQKELYFNTFKFFDGQVGVIHDLKHPENRKKGWLMADANINLVRQSEGMSMELDDDKSDDDL